MPDILRRIFTSSDETETECIKENMPTKKRDDGPLVDIAASLSEC